MDFLQFLVSIEKWSKLVNPAWGWICLAILCWKSPELIKAVLSVVKWFYEKKKKARKPPGSSGTAKGKPSKRKKGV